jgi:TonB family protein
MHGQTSPAGAPSNLQPSQLTVEVVQAVPAEYPAEALAKNIQGSVSVSVVISSGGDVERTEAADADPILQKSALAAARQYRFKANEGDQVPATEMLGRVGF